MTVRSRIVLQSRLGNDLAAIVCCRLQGVKESLSLKPVSRKDNGRGRGEQPQVHPPVGLLPHEQVLLVRSRAPGTGGVTGYAVLFLFGAIFLGVGAFGAFGPGGTCRINGVSQSGPVCSTTETYFGFGIGGPIIALAVAALVTGIVNQNARYFFTSFRIVETKRGKIVQQIPRDRFKGKPISQFLEKGPLFRVGQMSSSLISSVRVLDPQSGRVLMTLRQLPEDSVDAIESFGNIVCCQYCGQRNEVTQASCSQCGASL